MIKNGNYYFYDFEKDRDKFKEVLTRYYGQEYSQQVSKKIDSMLYVPYLREEYVYYYSFCHLNKYRKDVAEEFASLSGIQELPQECYGDDGYIAELCWTGIIFGENLNIAPVAQELINTINGCRTSFAKLFGIEGDDKEVERKVLHLMGLYLTAEKNVMRDKYPCDVFDDDIKYTDNKQNQLQAYLFQLNRRQFAINEHDMEIFNSQNFELWDAENLRSKYILFGNNITEGGLIESFCTQETNQPFADPSDLLDMYRNRLKFFKFSLGERGGFKYVSDEEVYDYKCDSYQDLLDRLMTEYQEYESKYPDMVIPESIANQIRALRLSFKENTMAGVKFCNNLARTYFGSSHDIFSRPYWLTTLAFNNFDINQPVNCVIFDESEYDKDTDVLSHNICHEIGGHVCGHGNIKRRTPILGKSKAISYVGIHSVLKGLKGDQIVDISQFNNFDGVMLIEEYCAERIGMEVHELFKEMYGRDIFEEGSDIDSYDNTKMYSLYRYYGFMLSKFWNEYRDRILKTRISAEGGGVYYDNNGFPPKNQFEKLCSSIQFELMKAINPSGVQARGILSYTLLRQLGNLLENYLASPAYEYLRANNINPDEVTFNGIDATLGDDVPQEIKYSLHRYQDKAFAIIDSMIEAEHDLDARVSKQHSFDTTVEKCCKSVKGLFERTRKSHTPKNPSSQSNDTSSDRELND